MEQTFQELPHWSFSAEEVSAGVYRVNGKNSVTGANFEVTVAEPELLLAEAKTIAAQMDHQTSRKSPRSKWISTFPGLVTPG